MAFFVFAVHQDQTSNRLYHAAPIVDRAEAETLYQNMAGACFPHDNYRVRLIEAETLEEAEEKADHLRPFPRRGGALQGRDSDTDHDGEK